MKSFTPSVNHRILQQKTKFRKDQKIFTCQKDYISILNETTNKRECVHFDNPKAQKIMLENLLSKDKINCQKITAPKQLLANCWFNVFFMCFFISDKGRKFFRYLREIMITGKNEKGKQVISDWVRSAFFHFNLFIEASLQGNNLGKLMDTNEIIYELSTLLKRDFPSVNEDWNPIDFYESIITYLKDDPHHILLICVEKNNFYIDQKVLKKYKNSFGRLPNIIVILINDNISKKITNKPIEFTVPSKSSNIKYILDSAIIRDTKKTHFACCLTCNKKEYGFDGESFSRISRFKWKHNILNKNKDWKFKTPYPTVFNFKKGLQYLFYYRV